MLRNLLKENLFIDNEFLLFKKNKQNCVEMFISVGKIRFDYDSNKIKREKYDFYSVCYLFFEKC